jgi:hypothetical protein
MISMPALYETCRVVEGHEIGQVKPGITQKAALKTVFVYMYVKWNNINTVAMH